MKRSIAILFLFLFSINLHSCDCHIQAMSVKKILNYDLAFQGKIIKKEILIDTLSPHVPSLSNGIVTTEYYKYTFKIEELIKGENLDFAEVYSVASGSFCGVDLSDGENYYIFSDKSYTGFVTDLCSMNINKNETSSDYKKIINDYINSKNIKNWMNINNHLIAKGEVINKEPVGQWEFHHLDSSIESTGKYLDGKKQGEWKYYLNLKSSEKLINRLDKQKIIEIENPKNIFYKIEIYEQGKSIKTIKNKY